MNERHCTPDELEQYFDGAMAADEVEWLELHLGRCALCLRWSGEVSRALLALEGWSARAHREMDLRTRVAAALDRVLAVAQGSALRDRLVRWSALAGLVGGAVRVLVKKGGEAPEIITEGLRGIIRSGGMPEFALAAPALAVRRGTAERMVRFMSKGAMTAHVEMSAAGTILAEVETSPARHPPLVMLVRLGDDSLPLVQEPQRVPGPARWVARFEGVGPGQVLVAFEPREED